MVSFDDVTLQATATTRVNLSIPHLNSAEIFAQRLKELEAENTGSEFGEFWSDVFANATAAVFATVAALESYANELFIDYEENFPDIREEVIARLWELFEQKPVLEKFEFALLLKSIPKLNRGASPYQDVAALIKLRNGLIHFKPEWFSEQEEHAKLSKVLKHKATLSPFFPNEEPLFPRGWASYKTTVWLLQNTIDFLQKFEEMAGMETRMANFRHKFDAL